MRRASLIATLLCSLAGSGLAGPALAQSIEVSDLDAPQAFAPGLDAIGGLEPSAWSGTSAERAIRLLSDIDAAPTHPIARDMLRRVVLGGLAKPDGAEGALGDDLEDNFVTARIRAAQILATPDEYAQFAARNPAANDPQLRAEAFLAAGDLSGACAIGDSLTVGRGETYWVRLRRACLLDRGETAAAELAEDLLRERGEAVDLVLAEPPQGLWAEFMARDGDDLTAYLSNLAIADMDLSQGITFDLEAASLDASDQGTAQLYQLALQGDTLATVRFVRRAEAAGLDPNQVLPKIRAVLMPSDMVAADLPLFARYAVVTRDLGLLQGLFNALDDPEMKQRLALASDAIGGGFFARPLGEGIEQGLDEKVPLAVHDALIALALGAQFSEAAEAGLSGVSLSATSAPDWIAIDAALDRNARAETLLRLAPKVAAAKRPADHYAVIRALRLAGFSDLAGQVAALAFLDAPIADVMP